MPRNWCWIRLINAYNNQTDSKKKIPEKEYLTSGAIAVVDQGQKFISGYSNDMSLAFSGKLPIVVFGDHTRCIKYVDFPFVQGADGIKVLAPKEFFLPKAFFYALKTINIPDMGYRRHYPLFKNYGIAVPPIPEQQRIVNRIERMFAKLDEAKEKAQTVVDGFEERKAAILHKAFTGKLTEKWRWDRGVITDDWQSLLLSENIKLLSGQDFKPENYNSRKNGIPYITGASNFEEGHVLINRWTTVPTVISISGDVLLVCKGSGYGKTIIADYEKAHIARQIMAIRVDNNIDNRFIYYYLQSQYRYLRDSGQGLIPGISRKIVLDMKINLPSKEEQLLIVDKLEKCLYEEKFAKKAAESVIVKIENMKKTILTLAFRGELGTNDPNDESAEELLKRVL